MKNLRFLGVLLVTLAMASPLVAGMFRVWVNQDAVQIGYELSLLTRARRQSLEQIRQLEVELAAEHTPDKLLKLANRLSMVAPSQQQVFGSERIALADGT
ncbi:MAG: hypothetical protein R3C68_11575 [Myxococcota bacterium]